MTNDELREHLHTAVDDLGDPGKDVYFGYGRINAYKALSPLPPHHFLFDGYLDELWLNFNPDGTVNGIDIASTYTAPVLGMWAGGGMLLFLDFPTGSGWELMMLLVSFPSLVGTGYFTVDGLTVDGPNSYQLMYVTSTELEETREGKLLASNAQTSEVEPQLVGFYLRPFEDEVYIEMFAPGKLNGYTDYPAVCYPAPILGLLAGGKMIFAMDYVTTPSCYALGLVVLDTPGLTGDLYRTEDGLSIIGPTVVWLEWM
jgi:hypothetical protein